MSKSTKATKTAKSAPKARKAKANPDQISTVLNTQGGSYILVSSVGGENLTRPYHADDREFRKLAQVGASFKAVVAWDKANPPPPKPKAQLARGVEPSKAPHSAKAVADQKAKPAAKATGKGKARTAKADKAKQPSRGADRTYVLAGRKDESKPDTFRRYMLTTIMKHKSTAAAKAAHAKSGKYPTHKLDFNWSAQQGYIKFTN